MVAARAGNRRIVATNKYGAPLALDPNDLLDRFILREGYYESEVFDAVLEVAHGDAVFWDVGANAGIHAVTLAKLNPRAKIICFEPSLKEVGRIIRSMDAAQVDFEILPFALSDTIGFQKFHLCSANSARNSFEMKGDTTDYRTALTSGLTADYLCFELGYALPTVVKIDVEGAEERVLRGMKRVLADDRCRRVIFEAPTGSETTDNPIRTMIEAAGFTFRPLERREQTSHNLENFCADK